MRSAINRNRNHLKNDARNRRLNYVNESNAKRSKHLVCTYLVSIQPWNYRYMLYWQRISYGKTLNKHRSHKRTPFAVFSLHHRPLVVGLVVLLLACVSRVQNQKRLSQGENCKHVNKSINSIFMVRSMFWHGLIQCAWESLIWFHRKSIKKNPHKRKI